MLSLMLVWTGCTKYSFQPMHRKVVGTWSFEKVKHRPGFLQGSMDVTKNFSSWEFTFLDNGIAEAYNINTRETKSGKWQMEEYIDTYYDEDGTSTSRSEYVLRFYLRESRGAEENYVWNIGSITAKRLRASEYMGNETYTYVMARR